MNKTIKKRWLKALRSGDYEQGRSMLCSEKNTFCCLGVLVDIEFDGYWTTPLGGCRHWLIDGKSYGILPTKFRQQVGITDTQELQLSRMNDNTVKKSSFNKIADWIEKHL